jgi:XTP/dITP diphosphohydrolase
MKFVLATNNPGKLKEMAAILGQLGVEVISPRELGIAMEVEETGTTFAENAMLKAKAICEAAKLPAIADDSGLCVDALNGAPGVYSARYAGEHGNDAANNAKLLADLATLPADTAKTARFMCAMCLAEGGRVKAEFIGKVEGSITATPAGEHGFGYDPLFVPHGYTCTMAQLPAEEKNRISHRADALQQFLAFINRLEA